MKQRSRLFAFPSDLLFVEEEVGILMPALSAADHITLEPDAEELAAREEEDEEARAAEPARIFVGMPVKMVIGEDEDDDDEFGCEITLETAPIQEPLQAPPRLLAQAPSLGGAHGNPFDIIEIVDDEGFVSDEEPCSGQAQSAPAVIPIPTSSLAVALAPAPAAAAGAEASPAAGEPKDRSLALAFLLAAASVLLALWVG